ncbi:hypothetical protein HMPREF0620_0699 [Parascardovia denticolens DSM 10105 = JCM 12538]|uniref:Uncharacterized protein n=1 Tax=Parascardovia denticolens DSM 10105 = JCM 12538 TaxID=864564 RepID=E6K1L3_PARDN|nr:hypothetical protein HMPREF0620_0699 [Parascardovia denticolens DSM 10105 = JCM 12538]
MREAREKYERTLLPVMRITLHQRKEGFDGVPWAFPRISQKISQKSECPFEDDRTTGES